MILFIDETGPLIKYESDMLTIEDLNPQTMIRWKMSRLEMLKLGWRCLKAAVFAK